MNNSQPAADNASHQHDTVPPFHRLQNISLILNTSDK